jgi:hypothetical protein
VARLAVKLARDRVRGSRSQRRRDRGVPRHGHSLHRRGPSTSFERRHRGRSGQRARSRPCTRRYRWRPLRRSDPCPRRANVRRRI